MTRFITRTLTVSALLVAGSALAHPGHGTPHLLHEADAMLGWWLFAAVCAAVAGRAIARRRS